MLFALPHPKVGLILTMARLGANEVWLPESPDDHTWRVPTPNCLQV